MIVLAIIMGSISSAQQSTQVIKEKEELSNSLQQGGTSQTDTAKTEQTKTENKKVTLEITSKNFHEADYMSGNYQDQITMDLKFTNATEKEIRGVEGVLTFYDIFDNKISATKVSYDKGIPANESKVWKSGTDYHIRLIKSLDSGANWSSPVTKISDVVFGSLGLTETLNGFLDLTYWKTDITDKQFLQKFGIDGNIIGSAVAI